MEKIKPILIVEGNHTLRELMVLSLSRLGFPIVTAQDSVQALDIARTQFPILIVLDLFLPRSNAIELLTTLRKIKQISNTKIIAITSLGYREVIRKAQLAGADDFLIKPFDTDELVSRAQCSIAYPLK